jgi:hypothetical protein
MRKIIPDRPLNIGICLSTHAAPAYIELGLACLRKFEGDVPVLVHDDNSDKKSELQLISAKYEADFSSTTSCKGAVLGDMAAFAECLAWAENKDLDVVVKLSRRFIFNRPWRAELESIFHGFQAVTVTGADAYWGYGFRSEAVAMHVPTWIACGNQLAMAEIVRLNKPSDNLPEAEHHNFAKKAFAFAHPCDESISHLDDSNHPDADYVLLYERHYKRSDNCYGFSDWPILGLSRKHRTPGTLWHDNAAPEDYYELAREYELPYGLSDFELASGE